MNKIIVLVVLSTLCICVADEVKFYQPSFDCSKVKENSVDYEICTNEELAELDVELNHVWKSFSTLSKPLIQSQRNWLHQKNRCTDTDCIKKSYIERIHFLQESAENQKSYPKEVLNAIHASLDMDKEKFDYYPDVSAEMAQEYFEAYFTFKMRFKEPVLKDVAYDNPKLQEMLGECKEFRIDKTCYAYGKGDNYDCNEFPDPIDFDVWQTHINNIPNTLMLRKEHHYYPAMEKRTTSKTLLLLNSQECKIIKEGVSNFTISVERPRYASPCKTLNKEECLLSRNQGKLLKTILTTRKTNVIVTYQGRDYLFETFHIPKQFSKFLLTKILDTNDKFDSSRIFDIEYRKGQ